MENLQEIIKKERLPNNSLISFRERRQSTEISIYQDRLTTQGIIKGISKIKKSFPSLPIEFYEILKERIKANGFSDERFIDAINHVIDNCHYPTPTIAEFISFNIRIKILSYEDMLQKIHEIGDSFNKLYTKIEFNGNSAWINNNDLEK